MRQKHPTCLCLTRLDALTLPPDAPASWALSPALTPLTPCCVAGNVVHLRLHLPCLDTLHVHIGSANNTGQSINYASWDGSIRLLERREKTRECHVAWLLMRG